MPIKIEYKTEQEVRDLPMTGLVSYSEVIDETYRLLEQKGLTVKNTIYKPNSNGDTVTAIYILNDIEEGKLDGLQPSITWTHSYHKAIRFSCNTSCIDESSEIMLVTGLKSEPAKARRSSDADKYRIEIFEDLELEISFCKDEFKKISDFKELMESKSCSISTASITLGVLYLEEDILTTSQVSIVKDYLKTINLVNGWDMYKAFGEALKESHPKLYLQNYINMYNLFKEIFSEEEQEKVVTKEVRSNVDREILEEYNFIPNIPSVTFL